MLLITLLLSSVVAGIEIAPYTVIKDHSTWEEREFPARKWISVDGVSEGPNEAGMKYFNRLFNYIDGQNADGQKIDMTAPVSFKIHRETGNFTMSFFIPEKYQSSPPLPKDKDLYIEERPAMRVAANRFGGYPNDKKFLDEAAILKEQAEGEGLQVADEVYWTAGYSAPFQIVLRRNEVWLELN